ncbi:MAG: hypothetical protein ACTSU5_02510 [Promethearchaeota archaeon]
MNNRERYVKLHDYHTHNGFYRGSLEEWPVSAGWAVARDKGVTALGICPKVEFNHPKQDFLPYLRGEVDDFRRSGDGEPDVFLGVELDIGDPRGKIVLHPESAKLLDYVIAGPHNQPVRSLTWGDLEADELEEYFSSYGDILVNSLAKVDVGPGVLVWAHPFLQEIEYTAGRYWRGYLESIFADVLDVCAGRGIALEVNENFFRRKEPPQESSGWWVSPRDYYREKLDTLRMMFKRALAETDVQFSFASDTHQLRAVGDIRESVAFALEVGIPQGRLLELDNRAR